MWRNWVLKTMAVKWTRAESPEIGLWDATTAMPAGVNSLPDVSCQGVLMDLCHLTRCLWEISLQVPCRSYSSILSHKSLSYFPSFLATHSCPISLLLEFILAPHLSEMETPDCRTHIFVQSMCSPLYWFGPCPLLYQFSPY